ncbi:MAG: hypothetical protein ABJN75_07900 [Hoeflea sp.]|uniref:hypothetical protein n=1 Tax=Hoeflea sp. TaxID=1940281 RepID=UPI0032977218
MQNPARWALRPQPLTENGVTARHDPVPTPERICCFHEENIVKFRQFGLKIIAASAALIALSGTAQAGFCQKYKQTRSNAGACANCFVLIRSFPEKQLYAVTGTNGWYAELVWVEGDDSVATGAGKWRDELGGTPFELDLVQQGSELSMVMNDDPKRQQPPITAKFRCVQR